jgi:hypothetical protein
MSNFQEDISTQLRKLRGQVEIFGVVQKVPFPGYTGSGQSRARQGFPRFECYPDLNHAQKWLSRRDRQNAFQWTRFNEMLKRHPLPPPKIFHPYVAVSKPLS